MIIEDVVTTGKSSLDAQNVYRIWVLKSLVMRVL